MTLHTTLEAMPQKLAGRVTNSLSAVVNLLIVGGVEVEAIVDTGFDATLTLPSEVVEKLGLPFVMHVEARLAGGVKQLVDIVSAQIEWLGEVRRIDVLVMPACLLGAELLNGTRLTIDYEEGTVLIEKK